MYGTQLGENPHHALAETLGSVSRNVCGAPIAALWGEILHGISAFARHGGLGGGKTTPTGQQRISSSAVTAAPSACRGARVPDGMYLGGLAPQAQRDAAAQAERFEEAAAVRSALAAIEDKDSVQGLFRALDDAIKSERCDCRRSQSCATIECSSGRPLPSACAPSLRWVRSSFEAARVLPLGCASARRFSEAARLRDLGAGLVGWWAGRHEPSDASEEKDPHGCIMRVSPAHGRFVGSVYAVKDLVGMQASGPDANSGFPVLELFVQRDASTGKEQYKLQPVAVYGGAPPMGALRAL